MPVRFSTFSKYIVSGRRIVGRYFLCLIYNNQLYIFNRVLINAFVMNVAID